MDKIVSYTTSELVNNGLLALMHDYFYTLLQIFMYVVTRRYLLTTTKNICGGACHDCFFCLPPELYCTGIQSYLFFTHFSVQLSNL